MMQQSTMLQYADAPARNGITYGQTADGFLITIQIPIWRRAAALATALPLVVLFLTNIFVAIVVFAVIIIAAVVRQQFTRPTVIELTADELVIQNLLGATADYRVPRDAVYDVRYVSHSGNIVIHARGQEMLEFRPVGDCELLKWLAETIQTHLAPPLASAAGPETSASGR
jgi:hypothetical protein